MSEGAGQLTVISRAERVTVVFDQPQIMPFTSVVTLRSNGTLRMRHHDGLGTRTDRSRSIRFAGNRPVGYLQTPAIGCSARSAQPPEARGNRDDLIAGHQPPPPLGRVSDVSATRLADEPELTSSASSTPRYSANELKIFSITVGSQEKSRLINQIELCSSHRNASRVMNQIFAGRKSSAGKFS